MADDQTGPSIPVVCEPSLSILSLVKAAVIERVVHFTEVMYILDVHSRPLMLYSYHISFRLMSLLHAGG